MSGEGPNLRERRRTETQRMIQAHAMRLFGEDGYDATTVNQVAQAAGVSTMTVYRHFPTKEDLVLYDQYDPLIAAHVAARPADEPPVLRIGRTLVETTRSLIGGEVPDPSAHGALSSVSGALSSVSGASTRGRHSSPEKDLLLARLRLMIDVPALRAHHLDSQFATQKAIVDALLGDDPDPDEEFRSWVAASTCLAAMHVALMRWAEDDGRSDLPGLIAAALTAAFGDDFN